MPQSALPALPSARELIVHGDGPLADALEAAAANALAEHGWGPMRERRSSWTGVQVDAAHLVLTDGRPVHEMASAMGVDDLAVFDLPLALPLGRGAVLAYAVHPLASPAWTSDAPAWLQVLGFMPKRLLDTPGLVVARTIAMLVNEAADAVQQGVCTADGADAAMKLGVNYPGGPFEWLARLGEVATVEILDALDAAYRGERYRVSLWLRQRVRRSGEARRAVPAAPVDGQAG